MKFVSRSGRRGTINALAVTDEAALVGLEIAEALRPCETMAGATEEATVGQTSGMEETDTALTADGRTDHLAVSSKTTGETEAVEMTVVEDHLLALEVRLEDAEDPLLQLRKGKEETRLLLIRDLTRARGHARDLDHLLVEDAGRLRSAAPGLAHLQEIAIATETAASVARGAGGLPPEVEADHLREARTSA